MLTLVVHLPCNAISLCETTTDIPIIAVNRWWMHTKTSLVPRLSPRPNGKRRGRAWDRFARDIAVRRRHSNNYKSRDAIMQPRDWLTRTATILLLKQVSGDCVGETSARLKQRRRRSTGYVGKTLAIYCYPMFCFIKLLRGKT